MHLPWLLLRSGVVNPAQDTAIGVAGMNRETSIYLDLVRFTAALTVFFGHLSGGRFTGGLFWQIGDYADQAVDVFFVLSGFVIAYVADRSETNLSSYAVSRLARVYSVAFPALVVTFVLDAIGRSIHPDYYSIAWGYVTRGQATQFITSLFFVNRLWWNWIKEGSDVSYWSLSYEVWYYVIFAAAFFARGRWRVPAALAAMCIAGPDILALFPLWLLGVGSYQISKRKVISARLGLVLCILPILAWAAYEFLAWHGHRLDQTIPDRWFHRSQIVQDYLVASLFAVHLIGFQAISQKVSILNRFARQIRWAAGATFTLYLFHVPLAQFFTTIVPWPPSSWATRFVMFPITLALIFVIAEFTERRKEWWRHVFAVILAPRRMASAPS